MATVGFGLESANVVGYADAKAGEGCFKALATSFAPVTEKIDLQ